jgi:basic membrane protein A and related proteins
VKKTRKATGSIGALVAVAVAASALIATGVSSAAPQAAFKMAIVTDIGSLQDRSFNQLANSGRIAVGKELRIQTRVYETKSEAQRIPNMLAASRAGYNVIFAVGFLNFTALDTVAPKFPKLQYVGIDEAYALFKHKPKNAAGQQSAEQEAGYLVGYLAGLQIKKQGGKQIISAVGAIPVPAIIRYISGYIQGAKKANPKIKVIANYADDNTFSDQAKCKETALGQIQKGTQAIFQVAGGCGLGALSAAKEGKIWGIGVDADQLYLGSFMMTSALKTVDKAVSDLTKLAYAGNLATQRDYNYNLRNNGVGLGSVSPKISKSFVAKTKAIAVQIAAGKIKVKPTIKF